MAEQSPNSDTRDETEIRLYLLASLILIQSVKFTDWLATFGVVTSTEAATGFIKINSKLLEFILIDLAFLTLVNYLKVNKLKFNGIALSIIIIIILLGNWILFGENSIKVITSFVVPSFFSTAFTLTKSLRETTLIGSRKSIIGTEDSHLGGLHTVHIRSFGTAQLNPSKFGKSCYCLGSSLDSVQLPVLLNSTSISQLTYSVTSFDSNIPITYYNISAADLIQSPSTTSSLDDWSESTQVILPPTLHHPLLESSSPTTLSSTQSLYYLPIRSLGIIKLESGIDVSGQKIIVKRSSTSLEGVRIVKRPSALFNNSNQLNYCTSPSSVSIGLTVSGGKEPLSIKWHEKRSGKPLFKSLEGIVVEEGLEQVILPINLSLELPGRAEYIIDSINDECGNEIIYEKVEDKIHQIITVHSPPLINFASGDSRIFVAKDGKKKGSIPIKIDIERNGSSKSVVTVRFSPLLNGDGWTRDFEIWGNSGEIPITSEGSYELIKMIGSFCPGVVLVPSQHIVSYQPPPAIEVDFTKLLDDCQSEVGAIASLKLTGSPPFLIYYSIIQTNPKSKVQRFTKRINHSRAEIKFDSKDAGHYEYRFDKIEDNFYKEIEVNGNSHHITVPKIATASWKNEGGKTKSVQSCEGEHVIVEVELEGIAPWELTYAVIGQPSAALIITKSPHPIDVLIPDPVSRLGGEFSLTLETVKDATGCLRKGTGEDLKILVRRTKPTARISKRSITILDTQPARIPLILAGGSPPFLVSYSIPGSKQLLQFKAMEMNVDLVIDNPVAGVYRLVSVRDKYCPGELGEETTFEVSFLARPTLSLQNVGEIKGICAGGVDSISLELTGSAPFTIAYEVVTGAGSVTKSLSALHNPATLQLSTNEPGSYLYQLSTISDSNYGLSKVIESFKQEVFTIPKAIWTESKQNAFCLNDQLESRGKDDLVLALQGKAPFVVELEVEQASLRSTRERFKLEVSGNTLLVKLPFILSSPSTYLITVTSISDSNGCESKERYTTTITVAESATITAQESKQDYCIGEKLSFDLTGLPPFSIHSNFQPINSAISQPHILSISENAFSRVADLAGKFSITFISHSKNLPTSCYGTIVDIERTIHDLPSVKMSRGDNIIDDIHEGELSEILLSFQGTPPFTFTYGRSKSLEGKKSGNVRDTVVERKTVTTLENPHSIFVNEEGTFVILAISDRYCSYDHASRK